MCEGKIIFYYVDHIMMLMVQFVVEVQRDSSFKNIQV